MKKFSFKLLETDDDPISILERNLNELGSQGYEFVGPLSVVRTDYDHRGDKYSFIDRYVVFQRQEDDEKG